MKTTKRMLAILLTLILAFTLALPAMAEESEPPVNWDELYIVTQPPEQLTVPFGADIVLSVEVSAPEGVVVVYQWQIGDRATPASEQPQLRLSPGSPYYPAAEAPYLPTQVIYRAIITAIVEDEYGNTAYMRVIQSRSVFVTIEPERERTTWESITNWWRNIIARIWQIPGMILAGGFILAVFSLVLFELLLMLPLLPFAWLFGLFS